jgi:predicted transcriptional regulator
VEVKKKTTRERVLAALRVKHMPVRAEDLAIEVGANLPAVKASLRSLRDGFQLVRSEKGVAGSLVWQVISVPIVVRP